MQKGVAGTYFSEQRVLSGVGPGLCLREGGGGRGGGGGGGAKAVAKCRPPSPSFAAGEQVKHLPCLRHVICIIARKPKRSRWKFHTEILNTLGWMNQSAVFGNNK